MIDRIQEEDLEFARRATYVRFSNALLDARVTARRQGWTDEQLAARIGMSVRQWREGFVNPAKLTLDKISDLALSCGCVIEASTQIIEPLPTITQDEQQAA